MTIYIYIYRMANEFCYKIWSVPFISPRSTSRYSAPLRGASLALTELAPEGLRLYISFRPSCSRRRVSRHYLVADEAQPAEVVTHIEERLVYIVLL
jgi:hypothetical protein